jgi:hypothetical protein
VLRVASREHEIRIRAYELFSLAGHNLEVNSKIGSRPNVSSRVSSRAEQIASEPGAAS